VITVAGPSSSFRRVEWKYDALGRRVRQTSYALSNGMWQVVEDVKLVNDPVLFGRHVAELNATNNSLVRSYVWGLDLSGTLDGAGGVGGLLWLTINSGPSAGTHFVCYDGNGNVVALNSASTGTETARYEYAAFGEPIRVTGPAARQNPFRFSTKRTDDTTDLVLYEYRAYNPTLGRWPNRDPIGDNPRKPSRRWSRETMNPYAFVQNDPVRRSDRLGLFGNPICGPDGRCYPYDWTWVCPSKCGPDYTAAVNAEIAAFRTHIDSFPLEEVNSWVDVINTTIWFGLVAGSLNYDAQAKAASTGQHPFDGCPSVACFGAITLCGKCVTSDVPGNVMFGFMREALIGNALANFGAIIIEMLDRDGEFFEEDLDVFPLGNELYRSGSDDICSVLGRLPDHATSKCQPCSKTGSFQPQFPFKKYPPPATLHP